MGASSVDVRLGWLEASERDVVMPSVIFQVLTRRACCVVHQPTNAKVHNAWLMLRSEVGDDHPIAARIAEVDLLLGHDAAGDGGRQARRQHLAEPSDQY